MQRVAVEQQLGSVGFGLRGPKRHKKEHVETVTQVLNWLQETPLSVNEADAQTNAAGGSSIKHAQPAADTVCSH